LAYRKTYFISSFFM